VTPTRGASAAASGSPVRIDAPTPVRHEQRVLGYLGLFSSVGTLLCCAFPSLLVLLGFGATVASVLASAPWLVTLSRHKVWVFAISSTLIVGNFYYVYRLTPRLLMQSGACDLDDPTCARASRTSRGLLWVSALLLATGFSVAYVLPAILGWLEG
jgi:mercuric ion transport protein